MPDRWEVVHRLNPKKADDAAKDADRDGLTNLKEFRADGDPRSADTDSDGVDDGLEFTLHTKLNASDSDGDGIKDGDDDANHDGICDRDQREAVGRIRSFDETTGELVLTTRTGAARTLTLTDDTGIERREHRGWAHVPGGELSNGPQDDTSDPSDQAGPGDDSDDSGDDWLEDDADAPDDADLEDVVDPDNADLLTAGTVVLRVRIGSDDTVSELRLA